MTNYLIEFISLFAIISSVLVITSKNPVISVIFLISLFINTAIYLILLGIGFVGISYIIIYVGAITVLFLFVILMINIRQEDIFEKGVEYTKNIPLALLVGLLFTYELLLIIPFNINNMSLFNFIVDLTYNFNGVNFYSNSADLNINTLFTYSPDFIIKGFTQISVLGQGLYTYGAMLFFIASLILLLSMVSALFITTNSKDTSEFHIETTV